MIQLDILNTFINKTPYNFLSIGSKMIANKTSFINICLMYHTRQEEDMWLGIVCFNNLSFSRPDGSYDYSYIIQNMIMNYAVPNEIIKIYIRNDNNKLKPFLHHESIWIGIQEIINKIDESFIIELR